MKILHLSDTHSKHRQLKNLPQADLIIHSGDASENGTEGEILDFLDWFCELDYRHKIFVAGNHDLCLYGEKIEGLPTNFHYLCNSGVEIDGVKFWGIPYFMADAQKGNFLKHAQKIPDSTDVLITHRPPYGILDFSKNTYWGCRFLLRAILEIRPKYHLFGHAHASYGIEKSTYTTFVNSALMCENYEFANEPALLEIYSKNNAL